MISVLEDNVPSYIFNMVKHSTLVEIDKQAKCNAIKSEVKESKKGKAVKTSPLPFLSPLSGFKIMNPIPNTSSL